MFWNKKEEKQHAVKCASRRCRYHGDMRIISNYMMGKCDCDGYHTWGELYEHRVAIFAALCNIRKELSWKSRLHEDGTMFSGMFIAGYSSGSGDITYHVEDKHWDDFRCIEVDTAPKWDGHTSDDVVDRLLKVK